MNYFQAIFFFFQSSDQLPVPQTAESRMAKMKKKISSPLMKRRSLGGGKYFASFPLVRLKAINFCPCF